MRAATLTAFVVLILATSATSAVAAAASATASSGSTECVKDSGCNTGESSQKLSRADVTPSYTNATTGRAVNFYLPESVCGPPGGPGSYWDRPEFPTGGRTTTVSTNCSITDTAEFRRLLAPGTVTSLKLCNSKPCRCWATVPADHAVLGVSLKFKGDTGGNFIDGTIVMRQCWVELQTAPLGSAAAQNQRSLSVNITLVTSESDLIKDIEKVVKYIIAFGVGLVAIGIAVCVICIVRQRRQRAARQAVYAQAVNTHEFHANQHQPPPTPHAQYEQQQQQQHCAPAYPHQEQQGACAVQENAGVR